MQGKSGSGFYFQVTDKDLVDKPAKPDDWRYLRQGALPIGDSLVVDGVLRSIAEARLVSPAK